MNMEAIKAKVAEIKIPYLVHFTRLSNLSSILQYGIYPRSRIDELPVPAEINDKLRLDHHDDSVSLSIAHPNSLMFYECRKKKGEDWVVLKLAPSLLWEMDCAFCKHNAADVQISHQPIAYLKTIEALEKMFEETDGLKKIREKKKLKKYDPTDVQAEVLVFGVIPNNKIVAIVFHDDLAHKKHKDIIGDIKTYVHQDGKGVFASRSYVR